METGKGCKRPKRGEDVSRVVASKRGLTARVVRGCAAQPRPGLEHDLSLGCTHRLDNFVFPWQGDLAPTSAGIVGTTASWRLLDARDLSRGEAAAERRTEK